MINPDNINTNYAVQENQQIQALRLYLTAQQDGQVTLTGLPCKKGQRVEAIVLIENLPETPKTYLTGQQLAQSEIVGLWKERNISDSVEYARQLRQEAQERNL